MSRRHLLVCAALVAVLGAGCGVRPSGVITGDPAPTRPAWGAVLYFVDGATLTPVLRPARQAPSPAPALGREGLSPTEILALLQDGPDSDERAVDLTSEVPAGLGPVSVTADASGAVDVVVSTDVTTLSATAVDQIVCTVRDALPDGGPITLTGATASRGPRTCPVTY